MNRSIVLAVVPAVAAVVFALRARRETAARAAADARVAQLENAARGVSADAAAAPAHDGMLSGQLLGVVSHELRSPISAILGYQELLAEGIFGPIDPRAGEALERIRHSAVQLLNLSDGMVELAGGAQEQDEPDIDEVELTELIDESIVHLSSEGAGRGTTITRSATTALPTIHTDRGRLRRVLDLLLTAAVKSAPNGSLSIAAHADRHAYRIEIDGARFDPDRDVPADHRAPVRSGTALRIAMARRAAAGVGASVDIVAADDGISRVVLTLATLLPPPT